ncbi:hypothetical protein D3C73_1401660 [compost metagenome]
MLFQLGFTDGGTGMLGQRVGIECLERDNGTSVAQSQRFIRAKFPGMGDARGQTEDGRGEQGSQGFHGCLRISGVAWATP